MADLIQWNKAQYWDKPWNPIVGCVPVSPACDHCYAKCTFENRFGQSFQPHRTNKVNPPRYGVVFCGNMTDLFGEWLSTHEQIEILNKVPNRSNYLPWDNEPTYLFCTKRVVNMCKALGNQETMGNSFFGFTAENQDYFDMRSALAEQIPMRHRLWLSAEPLLGHIELRGDICRRLRWVAVGCESGPNRRPCNLEWVEDIVNQCIALEIPVFVKQLDIGGKCERDINKFPEHLRIRQVPWTRQR